jgi:hypothetical protein
MAETEKSTTPPKADPPPAPKAEAGARSNPLVQGRIIIAVLPDGTTRPGIVVDAPDPENERPTVHAVLFYLNSDAGAHHSGTGKFVGRFADTESAVGSGTFPAHSWHWPQQTEPKALTVADVEAAAKPRPPVAEVGDIVFLDGDGNKRGQITAVDKGVATVVRLEDGTEVANPTFTYFNEQKAQAQSDFDAFEKAAAEAPKAATATKADKKK